MKGTTSKVLIDGANYEYINGVFAFNMYDGSGENIGNAFFNRADLSQYYGNNYYLAQIFSKLVKGEKCVYTSMPDDFQTKMAIHEIVKLAEKIGIVDSYDEVTVIDIGEKEFEQEKLNVGVKGVYSHMPTYYNIMNIPVNTPIPVNKTMHGDTEVADDTVILNSIADYIDSPYLALDTYGIPVKQQIVEHIEEYDGIEPMITDTKTILGLSKYLTAKQIEHLMNMGYGLTNIIPDEVIIEQGLTEAQSQKIAEYEEAYFTVLSDHVVDLPSGKKVTIVDKRIQGGEDIAFENGIDYYVEVATTDDGVELFAKGQEDLPTAIYVLGNNQKMKSKNAEYIVVDTEEKEVFVQFDSDFVKNGTPEMIAQVLQSKIEETFMKAEIPMPKQKETTDLVTEGIETR